MLFLLKLTILFGIVAEPFCLAYECPPGLIFDGKAYCRLASIGGFTRTPSGVTECEQLDSICQTYKGKYGSEGTGVNTTCFCQTKAMKGDCFEDNKLYVEGVLPGTLQLEQCFKACQAVAACQFFTWSAKGGDCVLSSNKPNVLISVPGSEMRTGTRDGGIVSQLDHIYVADAFQTSKPNCKISCESDPKCVSVTYYDGSTPYNGRCVKNYGPTIRVLSAFYGKTKVSSCQPCP